MACTGCAQRRAVLAEGARALGRGDIREAQDRLKVAGRSMLDDAQRLAASRLQAAKNRLTRR